MDRSTKWECMDCRKEKKCFVKGVLFNSQKFVEATNMLVGRCFITKIQIDVAVDMVTC